MKWCIYYSDGSIFTHEDGGPEDAPSIDVQYIAQEDKNVGFVSFCGRDYYHWDEGRWWRADQIGFLLYMMKPGWKKVLFGEMISEERFTEISRRVSEDIQIQRKTGYMPWERKPNG